MRKFLVGAILGALVADNAGASLISRSFLDQALTDYATNTALDLKANQSDFTELNTQISNSVDNLKMLWGSSIAELAYDFNPNKVNNNINGAFDLVEGFILHSMLSLTNGWTSDVGIGVRFDKYNQYNPGLEGMFNGWTIYNPSGSETMVFNGLEYISSQFRTVEDAYHIGLAKLLLNGETKVLLDDYNYTGPVYPIWKLSEGIDKIGTLPSGEIPPSRGLAFLLPNTEYYTYPTSIGDFMGQMYNGYLGLSGLAEVVYHGNEFMGQTDTTRQVKGLRQITDEIGTLPTEIPNMDSTWARYGFVETPGTPIDLPDTIGEMFAMLFNEDDSYDGLSLRNIMVRILMGFNRIEGLANLTSAYKLVGDSPIVTAVNANTAKIGTVPDGKNLAGMISETDAKIGDLPTEYATVGAALTAIKGIAEEAKAAAVAAIPDPKTEGSTGKFVLTVDIVGDNATYRWEKIDREDETTTTTE